VGDPAWPDIREPKPPRRGAPKVRIVVLVVAFLGVSTFGYLTWKSRQVPHLTFCEGIGLAGPPASTPRGALDAFFADANGRPSDPDVWHEVDDENGASVDFVNRHYEGRLNGFRSIMVARGAATPGTTIPADQWTVQGACL